LAQLAGLELVELVELALVGLELELGQVLGLVLVP
jgi:hypothetical protein